MSTLRRRLATTFVTMMTLATPLLLDTAQATTAEPAPGTYGISALGPISRPCGGQVLRKADGSAWKCSYSEDFDGRTLDASTWWAMDTAAVGFHSGDECYSPDNVSVANGLLRLTATKLPEPRTCGGNLTTRYLSGMISSQGRFAQAYGRFEISAKFPPGVGFQPAFWMLPANPLRTDGYYYGEIDVVEAWGNYPGIVSPHLHYVYTPGTPIGGAYYSLPTSASAFHTYAVEWTPSRMTFRYDGNVAWTTTWQPGVPYAPAGATAPAPFDQPFYVMLELAMGGDSTADNRATDATAFPSTMYVDYLHIWT